MISLGAVEAAAGMLTTHSTEDETLNHALMAIRDLPADQKAHWRDMFDYYVFDNDDAVTAHIPKGGRGVLDPMTPELAARLRAYLLRALSR